MHTRTYRSYNTSHQLRTHSTQHRLSIFTTVLMIMCGNRSANCYLFSASRLYTLRNMKNDHKHVSMQYHRKVKSQKTERNLADAT